MISDFEVRSKINKIFKAHILLKNIPLGFIKSIHTFMNNMRKLCKFMIINVNRYYLKLIFILVNIL